MRTQVSLLEVDIIAEFSSRELWKRGEVAVTEAVVLFGICFKSQDQALQIYFFNEFHLYVFQFSVAILYLSI